MEILIERIAEDVNNSEFNTPGFYDVRVIKGLIANHLPFYVYREEFFEKDFLKCAEKFYLGTTYSLDETLGDCVESSLKIVDSRYILDKEALVHYLIVIFDYIKVGRFPYSVTARIIGIVVPEKVSLENSQDEQTHIHPVLDIELINKYPIDRFSNKLFDNNVSLKHNSEFSIERMGTLQDLERDMSIEGQEILVQRFISSFLLAGITKTIPSYSHIATRSIFNSCTTLKGVYNFRIDPEELSKEQQEKLSEAYGFYKEIMNDDILERSFDRFLLAIKQDEQHLQKINVPNWDKLVDYCIALETIFLTINGSQEKTELSYRFRLNGSFLLGSITETKNIVIFKALNKFYEIRSTIVHGGSNTDIIKIADKIIDILEIDDDQHHHPIGRLTLLSKQLETWLRVLIYHLVKQEKKDRPYMKKFGWEDLIGIQ